MVRYLVAAAGVLTIVSTAAFAETTAVVTGDMSGNTVVSRSTSDGLGHKTKIVRHHVDRYGNLVTKKKIIREGLTGSSVTRVRKSTNPMTGVTTKERSTEMQ